MVADIVNFITFLWGLCTNIAQCSSEGCFLSVVLQSKVTKLPTYTVTLASVEFSKSVISTALQHNGNVVLINL